MRKFILFATFFLFTGIVAGQLLNTTIEWERIGLKKVGAKVKTDRFSVDKDKNYNYLKLRIIDSGILIEKWILEYRDGTIRHVGFVGLAAENRNFPPIQLSGRLKNIYMTYSTAEKNKKARVEILGTR